MRSLKTLGLALALAVVAVSASAEAKETELDSVEKVTAIHETSVAVPLNLEFGGFESAPVAAKTDFIEQTRTESDIPTSPEVLDVADGRWHSVDSTPVSDFDFSDVHREGPTDVDLVTSTSYGSRNAPVLRAVEAKTYRFNSSTLQFASRTGPNAYRGGDHRVCPLSSGVAPL